jgi:S-(hydroxymethyl)glutathione dehydrogenase/alcohol dehydrogenase
MRTRGALFLSTGQKMEVAPVDLEPPTGADVLVRMAAAGVCGSDLHVVKGEWQRPTPMVLGHEGAGVVVAVGSEVADVAPGDRVILSWAPSCQSCGSCRRGRPAACSELRRAIGAGTLIDGTTRLSRDGQTVYRMTTVGAFADHVVVPDHSAIKIPSDVSFEHAALLGCAALTGVGAVENAADVKPGSRSVVIGAGAVGQFVVQALRIAGAATIVAVDPSGARRAQALGLGATEAVSPEELPHVVAAMEEGFDTAFEAVGTVETARTAFRALRNGGTAVLVGMGPPGQSLDFDPLEFITQEKTLVGSIYGSGDPRQMTSRLLGYMADGRLLLEPMIGERYELSSINEAVDDAMRGAGGRVLVGFDHVAL